MFRVVYNRAPALLPVDYDFQLAHLRKIAAKYYCGKYLQTSQILQPRCAAGTDYHPLLSRYRNSCLPALIRGRKDWGQLLQPDWDSRKYLVVKAQFPIPLKSVGQLQLHIVTICCRLGEIMRKWKFFTLWTLF